MSRYSFPLLLLLALTGAASAQEGELFLERSAAAGIDVDGRARGVSVADFNGDGHPDLFVSLLNQTSRLYRNDGNARFTEVGATTPLITVPATMLSLWADFDNDGRQEVLLGGKKVPTRLFGPWPDFTDLTATSGIVLDDNVQAGAVFDFDGDGLLDVYLAILGAPNRFYHNLGNLQFEEVGAAAGADVGGLAMGVLTFDYDLDGDQDLYLVHDGEQANVLLRNEGGVAFSDVSKVSGADVVGDGMGVDAADFDGDGDYDLYVTNLFENFLLVNNGDGTFTERAAELGVNDFGMGWGTAFLDYDNDGHPDIYVANETKFNVLGRYFNNVLYRNLGGTFDEAAPEDAAINSPGSGYGTAVADFDGDGRTDLFIANNSERSELFLNRAANDHNWITFDLESTTANRDAIGSRVALWSGGRRWVKEVRAGGSFASQHDRKLHFGLGGRTSVDSLTVRWPAGNTTAYTNLDANQTYRIVEGDRPEVVARTVANRSTASVEDEPLAYPNPATDRLILRRSVFDPVLRNMDGRVVRRWPGRHSLLDVSDLPPGIYLLNGRLESDRILSQRVLLF